MKKPLLILALILLSTTACGVTDGSASVGETRMIADEAKKIGPRQAAANDAAFTKYGLTDYASTAEFKTASKQVVDNSITKDNGPDGPELPGCAHPTGDLAAACKDWKANIVSSVRLGAAKNDFVTIAEAACGDDRQTETEAEATKDNYAYSPEITKAMNQVERLAKKNCQ